MLDAAQQRIDRACDAVTIVRDVRYDFADFLHFHCSQLLRQKHELLLSYRNRWVQTLKPPSRTASFNEWHHNTGRCCFEQVTLNDQY